MRPFLPALCLTLAAAPTLAQEAFTWVYDAQLYIEPDLSELHLTATQQETVFNSDDPNRPDGLIWARCGNFGDGNVAIRFEAPAAAEQPGDQVSFILADEVGTTFILDAFIVAAELDPVGGPEIIVRADGPELALLANAQVVTYGLADIPALQVSFDLTANQTYVARFAEDCDYSRGSLMPVEAAPGPIEVGPNLTGHLWTRFSNIVEGDPFATQLDVVLGVPETDDVLATGQCFIGAGGPLIAMQIAADVTGLIEGQAADLLIEAGGQSLEITGSAVGIGAEFGVAGIELVLEPNDPAWLLLAGQADVTLTRIGGQGVRIVANGPEILGPYIADCANIGDLTPEGGTRPEVPDAPQAGFLACTSFGQVASTDTGTPFVVNFVNNSGGFRHLDWIDAQGNVVAVGALQPGEAAAFTTDPGHVWMATDGPGNCREMMRPVAGVTEYVLSVE